MRVKNRILLFCTALAALLPGCAAEQDPQPEETAPFALTVCVGEQQDTLDPALASAAGSETVLYHLYENLLCWEDGGTGWASVTEGQAQRYTAETDGSGHTVYTFTLRSGAAWSDGKAVTGDDFVAAWQRLADPATASPHRELLSAVDGYQDVQETGNRSLLGVEAPDPQTFTVRLAENCPWFLEEVCAGAYTMPVRTDLEENEIGTVSNGIYTLTDRTGEYLRLERSATYYGLSDNGPEEIRFRTPGTPEEDFRRFEAGELDLLSPLPDSALAESEEDWLPVTAVYSAVMNTAAPPFDIPEVRQAFRLAVDPQFAVNALNTPSVRAAAGLIPGGVSDYGERPEEENGYWDFRCHSLDKVTVPSEEDYAENCRLAQRLMTQAGYPNGEGFPPAEYLYVQSETGGAVAQALRQMWYEQLGVQVTLRGVTEEEYAALTAGVPEEAAYAIAAQMFAAPYSDAAPLLNLWRSGYRNAALELLLDAAASTPSADVRDAMLHDAEALLLADGPVIPIYNPGTSFRLAGKWSGLYRRPNGICFLSGITGS
ncbi:MAG: peptide ABC transporter substrate-binding protein [Oscillospiraceae bacterium]|nr:peptide ABC transporter substrate-binding protein [Oscillospiraceae bacterium]